MRSRALCRASKVLGRGARDPFRSRGRGSLIETLMGRLAVISFRGFSVRRLSSVFCKIAACSFSKGPTRRTPTSGAGRALNRNRDPLLTFHVALEAPPFRSKDNGREASFTVRADDALTARTRTAARAPRKGYIAYDPKRLPSCSQFETCVSHFKGPCVFGQNTWAFNDTRLRFFHSCPRQREREFPSS